MTIYSGIQQKLTEYREQQDVYWNDLQKRINRFGPEFVSYLGVEGFVLRDVEDAKYPVVIVGVLEGENVKKAPVFEMKKIEDTVNSLQFYVQVNLSKSGSEILDCALTFECHFRKADVNYVMNISGKDVECPKITDKTDFTKAFAYMVVKLEEFIDKSRYE